jgi:hypothetical protein
MDHKEQHHQKHVQEREHEKKEHRKYEQQQQGKNVLPFHPAWLFVVGAVLAVAAMLFWILFLT